jgi:hypothetical protein
VVLIILESFKWRSRIKLRKSLLKKN